MVIKLKPESLSQRYGAIAVMVAGYLTFFSILVVVAILFVAGDL
jgi:hypothetical protein